MSGYSTNTDVSSYINACALISLTNGDGTSTGVNEDQINYARSWATAEIDSFLTSQYDVTNAHALKPDWLVHCETILICVWLCRHTANGTIPPGLQAMYDERIKYLGEIQKCQKQIPGLARRADHMSMSNLHHDQRYTGGRQVRTVLFDNTGDQASTQVRNLDFGNPGIL